MVNSKHVIGEQMLRIKRAAGSASARESERIASWLVEMENEPQSSTNLRLRGANLLEVPAAMPFMKALF